MKSTVYLSPVTANSVTGFDSLKWSGESRMFCGFFASGVPKLWAGRAGSRKARRCSTGLSTRSVPPTPFDSGRRFVQRTGARTMANLTPTEAAQSLGRHAASILNPFIGIHAEETIEHCTHAVSDLGYIISSLDSSGCDFDKGNLFRIFEAITSALRYEITQPKGENHV